MDTVNELLSPPQQRCKGAHAGRKKAFNYEPWSAYRQYRDRHRDMANSLGFEGRSGLRPLDT